METGINIPLDVTKKSDNGKNLDLTLGWAGFYHFSVYKWFLAAQITDGITCDPTIVV